MTSWRATRRGRESLAGGVDPSWKISFRQRFPTPLEGQARCGSGPLQSARWREQSQEKHPALTLGGFSLSLHRRSPPTQGSVFSWKCSWPGVSRQVAIRLARGLQHLSMFFAGLPVWQLGGDANRELAGAKRTGGGDRRLVTRSLGFALFRNQHVASMLKTRGCSSHKLPGDTKAR